MRYIGLRYIQGAQSGFNHIDLLLQYFSGVLGVTLKLTNLFVVILGVVFIQNAEKYFTYLTHKI